MTAGVSRCECLLYAQRARRFRTTAILGWSAVVFGFVLSLTVAQALFAQQAPLKAPGAGLLTGHITDTLGTPLADVAVVITKLKRQTRTRADGSFRFDSVPPGTYEITARSIGLIAGAYQVVVGRDGAAVTIPMIRLGTVLQARVTVADRGGLSGVIGDTAYRALREVDVLVMGGVHHTKTDSAGAFFLPLKPGNYMLQLESDGFARQMISVTVPKDEGRRIAAWMVPESGNSNHRESWELYRFNERVMRASPASSRYFSREALQSQNIPDLQALAPRWAVGRITGDCMVQLNGSSVWVPLGTLTTDQLEFVEVYLPSKIGSVRGGTSMSGAPTKITTSARMQPGVSTECGNLSLIAWTRK